MKWREMKGNVELLDMCMCIVFAFQLIRAKEVRIDIEVKRSEEKWREVMTCDVSPVAMFLLYIYSNFFKTEDSKRRGEEEINMYHL